MASVLPIDNASIGGTTITSAEFVSGSGSLTRNGQDIAQTTADGKIHNIRQAVNKQGQMELYGDKTDLNNSTGVGTTHTLKYETTEAATGTGICTAVYNSNSKTTQVTINYDPE